MYYYYALNPSGGAYRYHEPSGVWEFFVFSLSGVGNWIKVNTDESTIPWLDWFGLDDMPLAVRQREEGREQLYTA